ncbi:MAG: glycosyltransferase [Actinomycetia bacterium]|nr:glycosyltransferase [Actinomycetes bacterium]
MNQPSRSGGECPTAPVKGSSGTARRVLTVLLDFPLPATTGLHLRMMGNLDALAALGVESHVLWFSTADRPEGRVREADLDARCDGQAHAGARVEQHHLGMIRRLVSKLGFLATGVLRRPRSVFPYSMRYDAAGAAGKIVAEVGRIDADTVVLPSQGMHWMRALPDSVNVIIDAADVLTDVTERLARTHTGSIGQGLGLWANHLACRTQERVHIGRAHEVWATTEAEAERFRQLSPGARVVVVPNTVPGFTDKTVQRATGAFGMIATWSYRPNEDAARRLLDGIAARVVVNSDVRLVLAGAGLPADLVKRCQDHPAVDYLGAVDDVSDFYDKVDVVAIPLALRGGVPLKLAEALARRRAVVVSPELVDGLDLTDGVDVIVARDDTMFSARVVELLDDSDRRSWLADNGVDAHRRCFSVDRVERSLRDASFLCR